MDTRRGWTCYRVVPRSAPTPTGQVLYVHGGGFIGQILPMHWSLIAKIANEGPAEVSVPIQQGGEPAKVLEEKYIANALANGSARFEWVVL